jgi:hypothetical protein
VLQAAAVRSAEWYEAVRSKLHLDPISFAYDYLRCTGRVDLADVRQRGPALAAAFEAAPRASRFEVSSAQQVVTRCPDRATSERTCRRNSRNSHRLPSRVWHAGCSLSHRHRDGSVERRAP